MADSKTQKDKYLTQLTSSQNVVTPTTGGTSNEGASTEEDYYEMLKNESYKALLSKEVQASNARDQALKYTKNAVNANGYGTQGLAESTNTGLANQYLSALQTAQTEYQNDISDINKAQLEKKLETDNTNFESLTTLMGNCSSAAQLNKTLTTYGYMKDGQWNQEKLNKLDENTRNQLVTLYNMYNSELSNSEFISNSTTNGVGYKDAGTAIQNVAVATGELNQVKNEINYIFSDSYLSTRNNGDCVKLVNGGDDKKYVYMIYYNGAWYQTTGATYNSAKTKEVIKGK